MSAVFESTVPPSESFGLVHLVPQVVAFAGSLADTGEHGETTVGFGDVVDELHDENGLADASATEQTNLSTATIRRQQVDDLDAGFERLDGSVTLWSVNAGAARWIGLRCSALIGPKLSTGAPTTFMMRPRTLRSYGYGNRCAGVARFHTADEPVGGVHRDWCATTSLAEVLSDLAREVVFLVVVDAGVARSEEPCRFPADSPLGMRCRRRGR